MHVGTGPFALKSTPVPSLSKSDTRSESNCTVPLGTSRTDASDGLGKEDMTYLISQLKVEFFNYCK